MKKILLIINGPAYGADETFNAIRLAGALGRREDVTVRSSSWVMQSPAP
ncbi:MAG TPA: hypothetical protein VK390_16920 [Propionibacteriaceae bacterium]|jgi:uncharacterized protein involved in oxidation of intracellular sulfur|nr:hypothetical protein [Propionibacteriaceae bacterium]